MLIMETIISYKKSESHSSKSYVLLASAAIFEENLKRRTNNFLKKNFIYKRLGLEEKWRLLKNKNKRNQQERKKQLGNSCQIAYKYWFVIVSRIQLNKLQARLLCAWLVFEVSYCFMLGNTSPYCIRDLAKMLQTVYATFKPSFSPPACPYINQSVCLRVKPYQSGLLNIVSN